MELLDSAVATREPRDAVAGCHHFGATESPTSESRPRLKLESTDGYVDVTSEHS